MAAKISISIADESLLAWAEERARLTGASLSAVVSEAIRLARQQEARARVSAWLGPKAALTPVIEAEIERELKAAARKPRKRRA